MTQQAVNTNQEQAVKLAQRNLEYWQARTDLLKLRDQSIYHRMVDSAKLRLRELLSAE